ncbi:hypothetical protein LINPERPRIM_LOCUS32553 [Linum perenne]
MFTIFIAKQTLQRTT